MMKTTQKQAQDLATKIAEVLNTYAAIEKAAGREVDAFTIMSSCSHVLGGMLAQVPEEHFVNVYEKIGAMVKQSCDIHRFAQRMAAGAGGTFILSDDADGNVIFEEVKGGPLQ